MKMNECLIIMVKQPAPGKVKTRLARDIGEIPAAELYACFLADLWERVGQLAIPVIISCEQQSSVEYFRSHDKAEIIIQRGNNIGERMYDAFTECFRKGYGRAILIGSDSPDIPHSYFWQAISSLEACDMVIGPTTDAGYYLVGFKQETLCEDIFREINWSTSKVWEETQARILQNRINCHILPEWYDIDTISGLQKYFYQNSRSMPCSETIRYLLKMEVLS